MATMTKGETLRERLDAAMTAVWDADSAWDADLDSADAKAAYKAARAEYKALANEAERVGLLVECTRCGGAGGWRGWPGFTCFLCHGNCRIPFRPTRFQAMPPTRAKQAAKFAAKRAAEVAAEDAKYAAFAAADPEVAAFFAAMPEQPTERDSDETWADWHKNHAFFGGLHAKARRFGSLSEKQRACVTREMAKRAEAAAEGVAPFPTGEATVEGEIVSVKSRRGYGGRPGGLGMLVKIGGGNRAFGAIPRKVLDATDGTHDQETGEYTPGYELVGTKVKFTAVFEVSRDDEKFGFFNKPKAATVVVLGARREA